VVFYEINVSRKRAPLAIAADPTHLTLWL